MMRWMSCTKISCARSSLSATLTAILATLRSWCEHDGQSQACADALGIHQNSLRYRMERIADLWLDPLRLDGMLALILVQLGLRRL